jgi:hypothetical protein
MSLERGTWLGRANVVLAFDSIRPGDEMPSADRHLVHDFESLVEQVEHDIALIQQYRI